MARTVVIGGELSHTAMMDGQGASALALAGEAWASLIAATWA